MAIFSDYLKQADELLASKFHEIRSFFGICSTGWHVLHSINANAGILKKELMNLLMPLAEATTIHNLLVKYRIEGIIYEAEEKLILTTNGFHLFNNCNEQQELFRQKLMDGGNGQDKTSIEII